MSKAEAEFRVWWVPQLPMEAFYYPVASLEAGDALLDALAKYDLFQYENKVKPDYCNSGGMEWKHPTLTGGEWESFDPEDDFEREIVVNALAGEPA